MKKKSEREREREREREFEVKKKMLLSYKAFDRNCSCIWRLIPQPK